MKFIETTLKGVVLIEPDVFNDPRGYFLETYHAGKYAEGGSLPSIQAEMSRTQGLLRDAAQSQRTVLVLEDYHRANDRLDVVENLARI